MATNNNYYLRLLTVLATVAVALGVALAAFLVALAGTAREAHAAFPGQNGKIAFASARTTGEGVDNPTGDFEIFTMNTDGTGVIQLTFNTFLDSSPSFSADGSEIVFRSDRDGNAEIYLMEADGSSQVRLTNNTTTDDQPTISPTGVIAYRGERSGSHGNQSEIISQTGGVETNLTNQGDPHNIATDSAPAFSPDGTKIAFQSNRNGGAHEVWVMNANGSNPTNVSNPTNGPNTPEEFAGQPDWSPDGTKIAFTSNRAGSMDIYVMNALDGSSQKRLTKKAAFDGEPAFSPDGTKIAFTSNRGSGDAEIYVMKAKPEGTKNRPKNLTNNNVVLEDRPNWQPLVN